MRVNPTEAVSFAFGPFKLIPSQQVLLRENRPVKLSVRALDILQLLVMRAGEEVTKNALIEFAWPDVFVDNANLKVHISSLRRTLGDTFPSATYIATIPGRGYQFVGQVRMERGEIVDFVDDAQGVAQLVACSLPEAFPLIGRQQDVDCVARALDFTKLVTLVGPGGVGKTSLAIAVAHSRRHEFRDAVHFVDLSAVENPALVPRLVATCLGVRGDPSNLISAVVKHLQGKRALIILDNCEHVLHATAAIAAQIIAASIGSSLLATSRRPLGINSENVQFVEPLRLPQRTPVRSASEALRYSAVELFALRALETADYRLVDSDANAVVSLCELLDGLPLAIEITAAKLDQFSPSELLSSVGHRFGRFSNADAAAHSRHQTLWATFDWSYRLLSVQEATIFRLLSVFAGSFEWSDVTSMARLVQYNPYQTTMALGGLVSKSLLSAEIDGEQLRYRLLQTARVYAAEKLLQDALAYDAQRHHAQIVLLVFKKSEAEWARVDTRTWSARYDARIGDLRKALDWCFSDGGDPSLGIDLTISATRPWNERSLISEQLYQVERALEHCTFVTDAPRRKAMLAISRASCMALYRRRADTDDAWNSAINLAELSGDVDWHLSAMYGRAGFLTRTGRGEQALLLLDKFKQVAAQIGDQAALFDEERERAVAEMHLGKLLDARTKLEQLAEDLAQGVPPSTVTRYREERYVHIHGYLAFSTWLTGRPSRGLALAEEVVIKTGQIGQLIGQSTVLAFVAIPLALCSGQIDALEKYTTMLRENLDCENIAMWEPLYRFYVSATKHVRGSVRAVDDMRSAVNELVRDGFLAHTPKYLGLCAEALISLGRYEDAEEAVNFAFTLQKRSMENWCRPELLRVKAKIKAAVGEREHARALLETARECALSFGARYLELRIVNDLADMALAEGNKKVVTELLLPVYESFAEKTATEDLKRSSRLLAAACDPGVAQSKLRKSGETAA